MKKSIYISIKPKYIKLIESKLKNYEFRNYIPKNVFNTIFVYESSPTCELKYVFEISDIIAYPNKINEDGYGNIEFNNGTTSKYAYKIESVYILKKPIGLEELRQKYNFTAPQRFAYDSRYEKLTKYLLNASVKKII